MYRAALSLALVALAPVSLRAQQPSDPAAQALAQGDLYQSKRKYDLALDAYHKADKLAHHGSAACYLKIASTERKLGDFPSALDDAKRAAKVAGEDKGVAIQAHLLRATLLAQMSGKPTDKKLREAEDEIRQALALDSTKALTRYDLGMVLLKQERDAEGIAELNTFIASPRADPGSVAEARRIIASPIRAREPFAPDFSFTTHQNQSISNSSLHGKVVLLDFWGTWCPPCRESVPILRGLQKKYSGKSFQLVGISSDDDEDVWRTFIEAQHMDWAEYIDQSGGVQEAFKIESFPTYIVLDKDGVIRFRQSGLGLSTQVDLEDVINKALKRESNPALAAAAAPPSTGPGASTTDSASGPSASSPVPVDSSKTLSGIEAWSVSGNLYNNEALGMSYEFPRGWIPVKPESLHDINNRIQAGARAMILQQHPEFANARFSSSSGIVFYASRKGDGDGERIAVPSLRINAVPTKLDYLNFNAFQQQAESLAAASGMKIVAPASGFSVKDHPFLRADFERNSGGKTVYQAHVQTLARDYLLTIENFAASRDELEQIVGSIQAMSIRDEDP